MTPQEVARKMNYNLGNTLVSALCNSRNSKASLAWESDEESIPVEALTRLYAADAVWDLISEAESDDVARAWFIGMNPFLGDRSPVMVIREGDFESVHCAAHAMVNGVWSA